MIVCELRHGRRVVMALPTIEELQEQLVQLQATLQQGNVVCVDLYTVPKIPPFLIKDPVM